MLKIKDLQSELEALKNELNSEKEANERLAEICFRHEAQEARAKLNSGEMIYNRYKNFILADFLETAISIFSYKNLPPLVNPSGITSKKIEKMIANFGTVSIFKWKEDWLCLPFNIVAGSLDVYGEGTLIKPYIPNGNSVNNEIVTAENFGTFVPGKTCIILSDFYNFSQTNSNISMTIREAIELYADLIADCESAKKINRNWINFPLLFSAEETTNKKDFEALVREVKSIIESCENHDRAIVSKYIKALKIIPTGTQYFGDQLEQAIKDYLNGLYNFLGIGTIKNENRARKITAEFEKTSDEYNINIKKRYQNRNDGFGLETARRIWKEWENVELVVNLENSTETNEEEFPEEEKESEENV